MRSVAGIAIKDGKVFVARRREGGDLGGMWEFPGGKCEPGESDGEALAREFLEELAVRVMVGPEIGSSCFAHGGRTYDLVARIVDMETEPVLGAEHREFAWETCETLERLDLAGSDRSLLPFVREALNFLNKI